MGVILPGRPIANVCFKVYGYMSMTQAISFLSDFKLGHYMKIPPRSMFLVQVHYLYVVIFYAKTNLVARLLMCTFKPVYRNHFGWNSKPCCGSMVTRLY